KPMTPRPTARFCWLEKSASGTDDFVMPMRLSSWRTAILALSSILAKSTFADLPVPMRCCARLIDARLHTATLSTSCGRVISVHRLERWMVPVLLFRARLLIVSFQVNHGWDEADREIRIALNCSRALSFLNIRSSPASAMATYSAYRAENALP